MQKCHKCIAGQSKSIKGGLCKDRFHKNCNLVDANAVQNSSPSIHNVLNEVNETNTLEAQVEFLVKQQLNKYIWAPFP